MPPYIQDGETVREMTWQEWTSVSGIKRPSNEPDAPTTDPDSDPA